MGSNMGKKVDFVQQIYVRRKESKILFLGELRGKQFYKGNGSFECRSEKFQVRLTQKQISLYESIKEIIETLRSNMIWGTNKIGNKSNIF